MHVFVTDYANVLCFQDMSFVRAIKKHSIVQNPTGSDIQMINIWPTRNIWPRKSAEKKYFRAVTRVLASDNTNILCLQHMSFVRASN